MEKPTIMKLNVLTRHGAIAAARRRLPRRVHDPLTRTVLLFSGAGIIGLAVAMLVHARLGLAPFDVLVSSVSSHSGLSMGQSAWMISGSLYLVSTLLGRRPSLVSLAFITATGLAVDTMIPLVADLDAMPLRIGAMVTGVALLSLGVAMVVHSSATGGSFELLMKAGQDRGLRPARVRMFLESSALLTGTLTGGAFGVGTVVVALSMGHLMQFWLAVLDRSSRARGVRVLVPVAR